MSWAQELKTLVADIKIGHEEREKFVHDLQHDIKKFLKDADAWLRDVAGDNQKLFKDTHEFLKRSEADRLATFKRLASDLISFVEENQNETKKLLHAYKKERNEAQSHWRSLAPHRKHKKGRPSAEEAGE